MTALRTAISLAGYVIAGVLGWMIMGAATAADGSFGAAWGLVACMAAGTGIGTAGAWINNLITERCRE